MIESAVFTNFTKLLSLFDPLLSHLSPSHAQTIALAKYKYCFASSILTIYQGVMEIPKTFHINGNFRKIIAENIRAMKNLPFQFNMKTELIVTLYFS